MIAPPARAIRRRSAGRLAPIALAASVVLGLVGAGCSGDDEDAGPKSAQESLDAMNITDRPDVVVANAVERLDPGTAVGTELGTRFLRLKYAVQGFGWADAGCAADRVVEIVTPSAFDTIPIGRLDNVGLDYPAVEAATRACASPESLARIDAPDDASSTTVAGQGTPNAAPDIDGEAVEAMLTSFYRLSADVIGLTPEETDCVIDSVLGDRSAAEFADLAVGKDRIDVDGTAPDVAECLEGDRLDVVTPKAAEALLAQKESGQAERDRVEAIINAQAADATATTVPSGG